MYQLWNYIKVSLLFVLIIGLTNAAYYVTDPNNCPNNYQSQTCSGSNLVCGYSGGVTYCYDMSSLSPPGSDETTTGSGGTDRSCEDGTCNGGFVVDCYDYDGSEPHCDNGGDFWCDRNSTCYNKHVQTTCSADVWVGSLCSATCVSSYVACDGSSTDADGCEVNDYTSNCDAIGLVNANNTVDDECNCICDSGYLDCDEGGEGVGNGCEVEDGGSCSVAGLPGTYNGCTCELDDQDIATTGDLVQWSSDTLPMLWMKMWGDGPVVNFTTRNNESFIVNASGVYFGSEILNGSSGGSGGNTTAEIQAVETDPNWLANYTLWNASWSTDTDTVGANGTFVGENYSTNINTSNIGSYNFSGNTTEFESQDSTIGIVYSWLSTTINNLIGNFTFYYDNNIAGNRTAIETNMINNDSNIRTTIAENITYHEGNYKHGNTTLEIQNTINSTVMNFTEVTVTNNITLSQNNSLCLNEECTQWIKSNTSGVYIFGGS